MIQERKDLFREITELTSKIQRQYPELTKYLEEMPNTIPNHISNEEGLKPLIKYKDSLNTMISNYEKGHQYSK